MLGHDEHRTFWKVLAPPHLHFRTDDLFEQPERDARVQLQAGHGPATRRQQEPGKANQHDTGDEVERGSVNQRTQHSRLRRKGWRLAPGSGLTVEIGVDGGERTAFERVHRPMQSQTRRRRQELDVFRNFRSASGERHQDCVSNPAGVTACGISRTPGIARESSTSVRGM